MKFLSVRPQTHSRKVGVPRGTDGSAPVLRPLHQPVALLGAARVQEEVGRTSTCTAAALYMQTCMSCLQCAPLSTYSEQFGCDAVHRRLYHRAHAQEDDEEQQGIKGLPKLVPNGVPSSAPAASPREHFTFENSTFTQYASLWLPLACSSQHASLLSLHTLHMSALLTWPCMQPQSHGPLDGDSVMAPSARSMATLSAGASS